MCTQIIPLHTSNLLSLNPAWNMPSRHCASFYLLLLSFSPNRTTSDADLQQAKLDASTYLLISKKQIVYTLSSIIFANKSTSVTHENKFNTKAMTKVYGKLRSNHHHKFSNPFWVQLSLALVNTTNLISSVSFNGSSTLSNNNYNFSLINRVRTCFQRLV